MATYGTVIKLTHGNKTSQLLSNLPSQSEEGRTIALRLSEFLVRAASGALPGVTLHVGREGTSMTKASGTITLSSASGTLTATINGVAITSSGAGTDTADATAMAAAINASTDDLVMGIVRASSSGAVVTITAVTPGKIGNSITTAGSGTGVTCDQTRLTGGEGDDTVTAAFTL